MILLEVSISIRKNIRLFGTMTIPKSDSKLTCGVAII